MKTKSNTVPSKISIATAKKIKRLKSTGNYYKGDNSISIQD